MKRPNKKLAKQLSVLLDEFLIWHSDKYDGCKELRRFADYIRNRAER